MTKEELKQQLLGKGIAQNEKRVLTVDYAEPHPSRPNTPREELMVFQGSGIPDGDGIVRIGEGLSIWNDVDKALHWLMTGEKN